MSVTTKDVTYIAELAKLRFSDEYYFSRFFKKLNGCSPATYRRRWLRG